MKRTWIVCADDCRAKLFVKKGPCEQACLCRTIPRPNEALNEFVHYVVEEIEVACGEGTESGLILCGENEILAEYIKQLSDSVRGSVIGTIERNLCDASPEAISESTQLKTQLRPEQWAH
ncbi:MAG: hypothetical protein P4M08_04480 [Oligoflexia bacterium]|nr:hypothetical protein [Oligoflexia bacterium]